MTRYVVLDTETTGLVPERDRIVWVAVAILEGRTVIERWATFLDPGPNSRVRVAGIDLAGQPTFAYVAVQLANLPRVIVDDGQNWIVPVVHDPSCRHYGRRT